MLNGARTTGISTIGLFALILVWSGTLLGVSFLATPAKFLAPSLTLPVALDVGRQTFAIFNKVEWLYIAMAALLLIVCGGRRAAAIGLGVAALVTALQTVWMLPLLDERVGTIIAGGVPPPSRLHSVYIVAEVIKLIALAAVAASTGRQLLRPIAHAQIRSAD